MLFKLLPIITRIFDALPGKYDDSIARLEFFDIPIEIQDSEAILMFGDQHDTFQVTNENGDVRIYYSIFGKRFEEGVNSFHDAKKRFIEEVFEGLPGFRELIYSPPENFVQLFHILNMVGGFPTMRLEVPKGTERFTLKVWPWNVSATITTNFWSAGFEMIPRVIDTLDSIDIPNLDPTSASIHDFVKWSRLFSDSMWITGDDWESPNHVISISIDCDDNYECNDDGPSYHTGISAVSYIKRVNGIASDRLIDVLNRISHIQFNLVGGGQIVVRRDSFTYQLYIPSV